MLRGEPRHQLAQPRLLKGKIKSNETQWWKLRPKNRARAEWTYELIVTHVQDPDVALVAGALTSNRQNCVGVDRSHCRADHFKVRSGKVLLQQDLEVTSQSERRLRVAQRRRFPKDENAARAIGFVRGHQNRGRISRQLRREKSPTEFIVPHENRATVDALWQKEIRRVTDISDAQP